MTSFITRLAGKKFELTEGQLTFTHGNARVTYMLNKEQSQRCYALLFNAMKAGEVERIGPTNQQEATVVRVARAIQTADDGFLKQAGDALEGLDEEITEGLYEVLSRAAIEAMPEPTTQQRANG